MCTVKRFFKSTVMRILIDMRLLMGVLFVVGFDDVCTIITPNTHITYSRATKTTHTKIIQLSHLFTYVPTYIPTTGYVVWFFCLWRGCTDQGGV